MALNRVPKEFVEMLVVHLGPFSSMPGLMPETTVGTIWGFLDVDYDSKLPKRIELVSSCRMDTALSVTPIG
jgi:hypothetical protein